MWALPPPPRLVKPPLADNIDYHIKALSSGTTREISTAVSAAQKATLNTMYMTRNIYSSNCKDGDKILAISHQKPFENRDYRKAKKRGTK